MKRLWQTLAVVLAMAACTGTGDKNEPWPDAQDYADEYEAPEPERKKPAVKKVRVKRVTTTVIETEREVICPVQLKDQRDQIIQMLDCLIEKKKEK